MGKVRGLLWKSIKWTAYALFLVAVALVHLNLLSSGHGGTMVNESPSPGLEGYADGGDDFGGDRRLSVTALSNATASYVTDDGWEQYQRLISFHVSRARATSGRGVTERKLRNDSQMYHLRQAVDLGAGYLREQTSPESLLRDMAASQSGLGPISTLRETREASGVLFAMQEQMQRAINESTEDAITAVRGGSTERIGRVTPFRYSPAAYRALAYYRYAARYGDSQYARSTVSRYVEELRSGLAVFRVEEASTTFEFVAWSKTEGGLRLVDTGPVGSGVEDPERFRDRVYYAENVTTWRQVYYYHAAVGRERFLQGGDHYESPLQQSGARVAVTYDRFRRPPRKPTRAAVTVLALNRTEHRKLTRIRETARRIELEAYKRRLERTYGRLYWEEAGKPTFHGEGLKRAYHRYEYLRQLLAAGRAYHPGAYGNETGVYLDSKPRIDGIRSLESEFDSAEAYRHHVRTQQQKLDAAIRSMNRTTTAKLLWARYRRLVGANAVIAAIEAVVTLVVVVPPVLSLYRTGKRIG